MDVLTLQHTLSSEEVERVHPARCLGVGILQQIKVVCIFVRDFVHFLFISEKFNTQRHGLKWWVNYSLRHDLREARPI